jgi:hypothetical protein
MVAAPQCKLKKVLEKKKNTCHNISIKQPAILLLAHRDAQHLTTVKL